jgi:hypothetical protein
VDAYVIRFEWESARHRQDTDERTFTAACVYDAKLEAAVLFALEPFRGAPPSGYRLLDAQGETVFRYPEDD